MAIDPNLTQRTGVVVPFGNTGIAAVRSGALIRDIAHRPVVKVMRSPGAAMPSPKQVQTAVKVGTALAGAAHQLAMQIAQSGEGDMLLGDETFVAGVAGQSCPGQGSVPGMVCRAAKLMLAGRPVIAKFSGLTVVISPPGGMPGGGVQLTAGSPGTVASPFDGGELGGLGAARRRAIRAAVGRRVAQLPARTRKKLGAKMAHGEMVHGRRRHGRGVPAPTVPTDMTAPPLTPEAIAAAAAAAASGTTTSAPSGVIPTPTPGPAATPGSSTPATSSGAGAGAAAAAAATAGGGGVGPPPPKPGSPAAAPPPAVSPSAAGPAATPGASGPTAVASASCPVGYNLAADGRTCNPPNWPFNAPGTAPVPATPPPGASLPGAISAGTPGAALPGSVDPGAAPGGPVAGCPPGFRSSPDGRSCTPDSTASGAGAGGGAGPVAPPPPAPYSASSPYSPPPLMEEEEDDGEGDGDEDGGGDEEELEGIHAYGR